MGLENARYGKLLYHLTELKNIESIIQKGLLSRNMLQKKKSPFADVADPEIILERRRFGLDYYVPFHFHTYSAFDVAVKNEHAKEAMAYICIHRDYAKMNDFKILPKHPLSRDECILYSYDEGIKIIDWDILMEVGSTAEEAKVIKMAECLAYGSVPVSGFQSIAVATEKEQRYVKRILKEYEIDFRPPYVDVKPIWFLQDGHKREGIF